MQNVAPTGVMLFPPHADFNNKPFSTLTIRCYDFLRLILEQGVISATLFLLHGEWTSSDTGTGVMSPATPKQPY